MNAYRFECTMCGDCCRRPGVVEVRQDELRAIARFRGTTVYELIMRLEMDFSDGSWWLEVRKGESCAFLENDRCAIEPVKPRQCRAYPFWPEILEQSGEWEREAMRCPGIGRGPVHPPEDVADRLGLLESDGPSVLKDEPAGGTSTPPPVAGSQDE